MFFSAAVQFKGTLVALYWSRHVSHINVVICFGRTDWIWPEKLRRCNYFRLKPKIVGPVFTLSYTWPRRQVDRERKVHLHVLKLLATTEVMTLQELLSGCTPHFHSSNFESYYPIKKQLSYVISPLPQLCLISSRRSDGQEVQLIFQCTPVENLTQELAAKAEGRGGG